MSFRVRSAQRAKAVSLFARVCEGLFCPEDPLHAIGMPLGRGKQSALFEQCARAALHIGVQTLGYIREFPPLAREACLTEGAFHLRAFFLEQGGHPLGHLLTKRLELLAFLGPKCGKVRLVVTLGRVLFLPLL